MIEGVVEESSANSLEERIARLERLIYLLLGLQAPQLIQFLGVL